MSFEISTINTKQSEHWVGRVLELWYCTKYHKFLTIIPLRDKTYYYTTNRKAIKIFRERGMIYLLLLTPVVPDTIFCNALIVYENFKCKVLAFIKTIYFKSTLFNFSRFEVWTKRSIWTTHIDIVDNENEGFSRVH